MGRYSIIAADPPWQYGDKQSNRPANYPRMCPRELRALNVHLLADDHCALFLWVTSPMLPVGLSLIRAWGFRYVTIAFVWSKVSRCGAPRINLGHYTRPSTEMCLLGMRGHLAVRSHSVRQFIESRPTIHSRKPAEARERMVELFGDVRRVELFARESVTGWDRWGFEAPAGHGALPSTFWGGSTCESSSTAMRR